MKSVIRRGIASFVVLLLVVIAIAMVPTAASAGNIFMLVQGPNITGGSTATGRSGWIDVLAFSGGATAPTTSTSKAPPKQPPPQPCTISVSKSIDIASPLLWANTVMGTTFNTIDIQVTAVNPTGGTVYVQYDLSLTNAQFTSIENAGAAGGGGVTEEVSIKAANATLTFTPLNNTGGTGTPVTSTFVCQ